MGAVAKAAGQGVAAVIGSVERRSQARLRGGAERRSPAPGGRSSRRLGAGGEDSCAPTLEMSLKGAQGLLTVELLLRHLRFFFSTTVYYEILNIVPCAIQSDLAVNLCYTQYLVSMNSKLLTYPRTPQTATFIFINHNFGLYVCESVSVLYISSFVSYFRFCM